MKLAIITDRGEVVQVLDDEDQLEDFDLSKPFPRAMVMNRIQAALDEIRRQPKPPGGGTNA